MKSKIEKLDISKDPMIQTSEERELYSKINELVEAWNSQDQPEERTQSAPMPDISSFPRRNGEYRYPEDYVGDPIGETTTSINQESGGACGGEVKYTLEELFTTEELRYLGEVLQREMFLKNNFKRNKKK